MSKMESKIKNLLNSKEFTWIEGLNYRDYIIAVWRTLQNDDATKSTAQIISKNMDEAEILNIISKNLKPMVKEN